MSGYQRGPSGHEPSPYEDRYGSQGAALQQQPAGPSSMAAVAQLFARLSQEIEEAKPKNCIHFIVDFLCKHYPEHLHGFASIWQMDPDLERERHEVVNFFKAHKISTAVAAHFTNAGYDTLDTLTTLNKESLVDVEAFNNVKWLPGHKVRLQQIFGEIAARVRAYRQQYGNPNANAVRARGGVAQGRERVGQSLFNALDRNGDGILDRAEFSALQAPTYVAPAPPVYTTPLQLGGGFATAAVPTVQAPQVVGGLGGGLIPQPAPLSLMPPQMSAYAPPFG